MVAREDVSLFILNSVQHACVDYRDTNHRVAMVAREGNSLFILCSVQHACVADRDRNTLICNGG